MLLTYDDRQESGWVVTRLRCGIHIGQLFQTQAKMYWPYDYCKYSQVLHGSESDEEDTKDPERHFDAEVNRIVSETDERISLLKRMGLYRLLTDTVPPMLTPQLSRLCITEDFRLF